MCVYLSIMALQSINWTEITFKSLKIWPKLSNSPIITHILAKIRPNSANFWPNGVLLLSLSAQKCQLFFPMVYRMLCESLESVC